MPLFTTSTVVIADLRDKKHERHYHKNQHGDRNENIHIVFPTEEMAKVIINSDAFQ